MQDSGRTYASSKHHGSFSCPVSSWSSHLPWPMEMGAIGWLALEAACHRICRCGGVDSACHQLVHPGSRRIPWAPLRSSKKRHGSIRTRRAKAPARGCRRQCHLRACERARTPPPGTLRGTAGVGQRPTSALAGVGRVERALSTPYRLRAARAAPRQRAAAQRCCEAAAAPRGGSRAPRASRR